ncbi:hypothetical protein M408DRAFT_326064 [Serendipita vermifera MAFF 305830]|uniref:TLC domain-containing protein n=1 Tax=Serendipita vermifera MAFF 305830 TaxID=933852 RepID=A0A0C3B902_SERVB|nr:hypothetical protein M408DRAFT_326064 [Serendipita vermifera MAFF 305830]
MSKRADHSRARSSSLKIALDEIEHDPKHHLVGALAPKRLLANVESGTSTPVPAHEVAESSFWNDLITVGWIQRPSSAAKLLVLPVLLAFNWSIAAPKHENFWLNIFLITNKRPDSPDGIPYYAKSYWDIAFVAYYIVFFSWFRETLGGYILIPLARRWGIRRPSKLDRIVEQGYAVVYFTASGSLGLWTMYAYLPTWYFRTEHAWIGYPHWEMPGTLKLYYLLQTAYWLQQFLLLLMGVEKRRRDFYELVAHHIVTLWMVIWSYLMNMTRTGNIIFLTMDWSDVFLSLSKCFNYLQMERTKSVAFAWFTAFWTYSRHYLNFWILYSHWYEFDLIDEDKRVWSPADGLWMPWWMKHQMFFALFALQLLNIFWYYLIWRILLRAVFSSTLDDDRSDDEDDEPAPKGKRD